MNIRMNEVDAFCRYIAETPAGNAVLHLRQAYSDDEAMELLAWIESRECTLEDDDGTPVRWTSSAKADDHSLLRAMGQLIQRCGELVGYRINEMAVEYNVFIYDAAHSVPRHRDMDRHKLVLLAYFGEFSGGEYGYVHPSGKEVEIPLGNGDIVLVINEVAGDNPSCPLHWVGPIREGRRGVVGLSLVSEATSSSVAPFAP